MDKSFCSCIYSITSPQLLLNKMKENSYYKIYCDGWMDIRTVWDLHGSREEAKGLNAFPGKGIQTH